MVMAGPCGAAVRCTTPTDWALLTSVTGWPSTPTGRATRLCGPRRCCESSQTKAEVSHREGIWRLKVFLSPAGRGRGQGAGADDALSGVTHLTLPSLRAGPFPLPPEGRRGAFTLPH